MEILRIDEFVDFKSKIIDHPKILILLNNLEL